MFNIVIITFRKVTPSQCLLIDPFGVELIDTWGFHKRGLSWRCFESSWTSVHCIKCYELVNESWTVVCWRLASKCRNVKPILDTSRIANFCSLQHAPHVCKLWVQSDKIMFRGTENKKQMENRNSNSCRFAVTVLLFAQRNKSPLTCSKPSLAITKSRAYQLQQLHMSLLAVNW